MSPTTSHSVTTRAFDPSVPSAELQQQWRTPGDIFSVLLILGGDVVARALAQLVGSRLTPVAFSFGWTAFAVTAVVSAVGDNKLMPPPDCACKVINGKTGVVRDNTSWVIGRIVRDFERWKDGGKKQGPIHARVQQVLDQRWEMDKAKAKAKTGRAETGETVRRPDEDVLRPLQAGLCVSIYRAGPARPGDPGYTWLYFLGFLTAIVQLGVAAIPAGVYGDWSILMVAVCGIFLAFVTGSLSQWSKEKWACRRNVKKSVVLTKGDGSQHAIVILSDGDGLDLEGLAAGQTNVDTSASAATRFLIMTLATLWIALLICAAGIKQNSWFLLAIGGIGIMENIVVAGHWRSPTDFGIPLVFQQVIAEPKVMDTLFRVEEVYPGLGASMVATFFSGVLRADERERWKRYAEAQVDASRPEVEKA